MENSKGPSRRRQHFTTRRPAGANKAERVNWDAEKEYSTDRKFSSSDRPAKAYGSEDRPRKAYGSSEDRPRKSYGSSESRPQKSYGSSENRPRKTYGSSEDRPRKTYGTAEDRPHKAYGSSDKPRRDYSSSKGPRKAYGSSDKPRRDYSDRKPYPKHVREDGIETMLSRKAVSDKSAAYSDNDSVAAPIKEVIRLNKYIANSGVCSRREADTYILAGIVTVNGEIVTELGTKVNVLTDDIRFNGERLKGEAKVYIVMNKPKGYVTTAGDPHADKTVMDLLKGLNSRVFPVGRLDKNTTGVLMFTNDGEIAEQLTHPSFNKKKIYQVILDKPLSAEDHDKVLEGITLSDGLIKADELEFVDAEDHRKLGIEIHSGKNRIVRRIFESMGYEVKALDRVYFAGLTKKGLKKGQWRFLTEGEINILKMGAFV